MAHRFEKEENGGYALILDGWGDGIGSDPYTGFGYQLSVDLETPGEVAVGYGITTNVTSGGGQTLGKPVAKSVRYFPTYASPSAAGTGSAQSYAILDANGRVWESTSISGTYTFLSSSNSTSGSSNLDGLVYWLGYLWKFRNNAIDYWTGSTWVTGWNPATGSTGATPITSGVKHFAYVASNNQLYFTNGNGIGRIFAPDPASFDPTSPSTYSFSAQILAIPYTDNALSLAEIGGGNSPQSTLLIGGSFNSVYPWDKVSTSYNLPISVADGYIGKMVSANQNAFIFPGNTKGRGRIYITNGSQADLYFKVPDFIFGEQDPYFEWGDVIFHRNNLLFGFYPTKNSGSGIIQNWGYVWALDLDTKAFRAVSALPTSATFVANAYVLIGAFNPGTAGFSYITAWDDNGSAAGIGYSGTTAGIGSASILTDLLPVGTFLQKKTFTQIEFKLRSPLQSGETISMIPIADNTVGTTLTFSPTPTTGSISGVAPVTFQASQWLQFIISMTGNSASSGVRLYEIRLR